MQLPGTVGPVFAVVLRPDPYPLSDLLARLPPSATELLGWVPALAVHEVGIAFDPGRGGTTVYARAGSADPAAAHARLLFGSVRVDSARPFLLGIELDTTIGLGAIPLFGEALRSITISDLSICYASAPIPEEAIVLPPSSPRHPGGYAQGPVLGLVVSDGVSREPLRLSPPSGQLWDTGGAGAGLPPVQWFGVLKRIGPLTVRRIGVITGGTAFGLALDAALQTTVLTIDLAGFTVVFDPRSDISPRALRVALEGLRVAFGSGALRLDAALTRVSRPPVGARPGTPAGHEYTGTALVKAGPYSISAVGSYAEVDGKPSLFLFGVARGQFGGVPAFFVTGLAAGFGYQRDLRLPSSGQVREFPLVLAAIAGSAFRPPPSEKVLEELRREGWVQPRQGAHWFAAGIAFESFKTLDGFLLLIARFGDRLEFSLLGVATIRLPKALNLPAYAYAELTVDAVFAPAEGTARVSARLTPNSYVLDRAVSVQGGFAAHLWFGAHRLAGDFVLSLGGYHPAFHRPDWYPVVPRLAVSWRISNQLRMAGEAYFALTPSGVMAGGALAVTFSRGSLKASFTARADFLMFWDPLNFDADIRIRIRVSYTFNLGFIRRTASVELSVDLGLWGPPVKGTVRVRWSVISFTISINGGQNRPRPPRVIDWPAFEKGFLPAGSAAPEHSGDENRSNVCRPHAAAGLLATVELAGRSRWLVSAAGFVLLTETAVPASRILIEGAGGVRFDGPPVAVYPMGAKPVRTEHRVWLAPLDGHDRPGPPEDLTGWDWEPVVGNVPYAIWGAQNTGRPRLDPALVPAMLGVRGTPRGTVPSGPPPFPVSVLGLAEVWPRRKLPLPQGPPVDGSTPRPEGDPREIVRETVSALEPQRVRTSIARALTTAGIGAALVGGDLGLLADRVFTTLTGPPMIGPAGSTGPRPATGSATPHIASGSQSEPAARLAPDGTGTLGLIAVFHGRSPASRGTVAHLIDHAATNIQRTIVARHIGVADGRPMLRLTPGTTLAWRLAPAAFTTLAADGGAPLWIVAFDAQCRPLSSMLLPAGAEARYRIPRTGELLSISALSQPTALSYPTALSQPTALSHPTPGAGWSPTTSLPHLASRILLAEGAIVVPQAPIPPRRARADGRAGLLSGRELAEHNRVQTLDGVRPGGLDVWLPRGTSAVTLVLRPDPAVTDRPGLDAAVSVCAEGRASARLVGEQPDQISASLTPGHRTLSYAVGLHSAVAAAIDSTAESQDDDRSLSALRHLAVCAEPGWLVDGVLGDEPLYTNTPASRADGAGHAFTEVVFG